MSLTRSHGPMLWGNYRGFSTKAPNGGGPSHARRRIPATPLFMGASLAVAVLAGVALGLRDTGTATRVESRLADASPAAPTPFEPPHPDHGAPAVAWPAAVETTNAPEPVAAPPPPAAAARRFAKLDRVRLTAGPAKHAYAAAPPTPLGAAIHIRPTGWPYLSTDADPPF